MFPSIGDSNTQPSHPLIEKARRSTVPIAELIGFRVDEITTGACCSVTAFGSPACKSDGPASRRCAL